MSMSRRLKWYLDAHEVPYEVVQTFVAEGGGTRLTTTVEGEPKGFFKIAEGALQGQLQKSLDEDGQSLKRLLEAS